MSRRSTSFSGQWAGRLVEMMESHAFRALSLSAHRVIHRVEIELAHHAGKDNGTLPVTFDDFQSYGVHRHAIAPAIREAVALGFLEITQEGRAGNAEWRNQIYFGSRTGRRRASMVTAPMNGARSIVTRQRSG